MKETTYTLQLPQSPCLFWGATGTSMQIKGKHHSHLSDIECTVILWEYLSIQGPHF